MDHNKGFVKWFLSVKIVYRFSAFSILIKHVSFIVAVTFAV